MNNDRMGNFIFELRKSKKMTQKQLAEKLNLTDKAVSKWERGLGYPDITILPKLAEVLEVTTNELLNGKKEEEKNPKEEVIVQQTLKYVDKVTRRKRKTVSGIAILGISIVFGLGILITMICDYALSGRLTWSLYPIASIFFGWFIIIPVFQAKKRKLMWGLMSLCIFIIPFLFCIETINDEAQWLIPLGIPISLAALGYLWLVYFMFVRSKMNPWILSGIGFVLAIPLSILINVMVGLYLKDTTFDIWEILSPSITGIIGLILMVIGFLQKKDSEKEL
ncbi:MAG: helix-turn-helix domain-containing protein [Eubacteriaceae bacterium]